MGTDEPASISAWQRFTRWEPSAAVFFFVTPLVLLALTCPVAAAALLLRWLPHGTFVNTWLLTAVIPVLGTFKLAALTSWLAGSRKVGMFAWTLLAATGMALILGVPGVIPALAGEGDGSDHGACGAVDRVEETRVDGARVLRVHGWFQVGLAEPQRGYLQFRCSTGACESWEHITRHAADGSEGCMLFREPLNSAGQRTWGPGWAPTLHGPSGAPGPSDDLARVSYEFAPTGLSDPRCARLRQLAEGAD